MNTAAFATVALIMLLVGPAAGHAQSSSAAPPPVNGIPADSSADYRLVPGDKLRIEVYKDPQVSQTLQIRPDGKITLPYVGDISAAGMTATSLRDAIARSLKEYIATPVVTVIVVETQPQTVSVLGEVRSPGVLPLTHRMTVLDALAAAGGFGDFANTKNIMIKRNTKNGVQTLRYNYRDAIKSDTKPFYLQSGDIVIVP